MNLNELRQGELMFLWDASSLLLNKIAKEVPYPISPEGMLLWAASEGKTKVKEKVLVLLVASNITRKIGELISIPEYQEQIQREVENSRKGLKEVIELLEKYSDIRF